MSPFPVPELLPEMDQLPPELLEKIFEFLPRQDRKTVVLVNSLWRNVGEASHLWAWVKLPIINDLDSCERAIDMLRSGRHAGAAEIVLRADAVHYFPTAVSETLLNAVIQHTGLRRMDIVIHYEADMGWPEEGLDVQLVTQAFTTMTSLTLDPGYLTPHLLIALLTKVSEEGCSLKELSLRSSTW